MSRTIALLLLVVGCNRSPVEAPPDVATAPADLAPMVDGGTGDADGGCVCDALGYPVDPACPWGCPLQRDGGQ